MHIFATLLLAAAGSPPVLPAEMNFMSGCWAGEAGEEYVEEWYGSTLGGVMLGSVKITRQGRVEFFEFLRIFAEPEGVWLQPWPRGRGNAPRFRLVALEADKASFENAQHDFPRRITYRLLPSGHLRTQVTGEINGEAAVEEYTTLPRDCGG